MVKLKILCVVALLGLIFVLGALVPVDKIDRFVLPDGCCNYCLNKAKRECQPAMDKIVFLNAKCGGQLVSASVSKRYKY